MSDCTKVDDVLRSQPHYIDGKQVECKIAIPKDYISTLGNDINLTNEQQSSGLYNNRKIFVGGLHPALKEPDMKAYFEQFGEVEQCVIMHDKPTGKSRGFGFVIFSNDSSADQVMFYKNKHNIMGKWVDCKRAMPKDVINKEVGYGTIKELKDTYKEFKEYRDQAKVINQFENKFEREQKNSVYENSPAYPFNHREQKEHREQFIGMQNFSQPINQNYVVNNYCK
jgi:RNA recognition motif-containing protein